MICTEKKYQKGTSAVEFAIVLPMLVLLVFGTIEVSLLFHDKQVLTNATREGARAGITEGTTASAVQQIVADYCSGRLINLNGSDDLPIDNIVVTGPDGNKDITVSVNFDYVFFLSRIIGLSNITVSAQTVMRMEPA